MERVIGDRAPDALTVSNLMVSLHFEVPGSILMDVGAGTVVVEAGVEAKVPGSILMLSLVQERLDVEAMRGRMSPVDEGTTNADVVAVDVAGFLSNL